MTWQESPEYKEKLRQRLEITLRCETDMEYRKHILELCYLDPVFWCNNFAWTYDPRKVFFDDVHIPFILFPKQEEYVRWVDQLIENREDGIAEKSRDAGISYVTLICIFLHRWLFKDFNGKLGSRKEDYVDKPGDMDSLFEKIMYNIRRLPDWMLPAGFNPEVHKTYMKLVRPDNPNTITGESANDSFSRGGRQTIVLFDEFGFWPSARASWEASGESTTTRLAVSTPPITGRASHMYKLSAGTMGLVKKFLYHYKDDPRKDENWEAQQLAKKSKEEFERELNISYSGSTEGTVYGEDFKLCEFGKFDYNPQFPLYCFWDYGRDGTAIQWWQWDIKLDRWYLIDSYFNTDKYIEFFVPFITGIVKSGYDYTDDDIEKINRHKSWRKDITHFGDPNAIQEGVDNRDGTSTWHILKKNGILLNYKHWAGRSHYEMKQQTIGFLKKVSIDEDNNEFFIYSIANARYPKRAEGSQSTTGVLKPIHDETSHHRSALEYGVDNLPKKPTKKAEGEYEGIPARLRDKFMNKRKVSTNPLAGL